MRRPFGRTAITFVSVTDGPLDRYNEPAKIRTTIDVPGCRFRPLPASERIDNVGDVVTDPWRATCPPLPAVVAAKAEDELIVAGVTYQIVGGPRIFEDLSGKPFKVTVIAQRNTG